MRRKKITPVRPTELVNMKKVKWRVGNHQMSQRTPRQFNRVSADVGECAPHTHKRSVCVKLAGMRIAKPSCLSNNLGNH
jgi:hypothetical protein